MSNIYDDQTDINISDDSLASSLPARIGPYRSLSAKRLRDPSNRKSVSFNDVPIVHEVPLHDTVRNSGGDTFHPWTYTEATSPISIISPFPSTNTGIQKLHPNRLINPTNRLTDWTIRAKSLKITEETREHNSLWNPPLIIVHTPDERTSTNSSIDDIEEKKHAHRSIITRNTESCRTLPFTYVPLSESSTAYASILSTNLISSNDQSSIGQTRVPRARSATLPIAVIHTTTRNNNDTNSITPFRPTTASSRTVLRPATIAFQCTQLTTSPTNITISKSPSVPTRLSSSAHHSRYISSSNRPLSSAIKYTYTHPNTLSRSRSANILNTRRNTTSPIPILDGQSAGINNTNLYASTKRNPNMRQTYGSYYTQRVLLPANIN